MHRGDDVVQTRARNMLDAFFGRSNDDPQMGLWWPGRLDKVHWRGQLRCPPPSEAETAFNHAAILHLLNRVVDLRNWFLMLECGRNPLGYANDPSPAIMMIDDKGEKLLSLADRVQLIGDYANGDWSAEMLTQQWNGPKGRSSLVIQPWVDRPIRNSPLGATPVGGALRMAGFTEIDILDLGDEMTGGGKRVKPNNPILHASPLHLRDDFSERTNPLRTLSWPAHFEECGAVEW